MRHILRIVCVSIIAFFAVFNASSATEDVVVGDFTYSIDSSSMTAVLTGTNNSNLRDLTIPRSIEYGGQNYSIVEIGQSAFKQAFWDHQGLTGSLTIPNSVKAIGKNAFWNCQGLTGSLTIPNSVRSIGEYAFYHCSGFTGSLTIPETVTSIAKDAFSGCSGFTGSLTIPNSVTEIEEGAFAGCRGLTGPLTIPGSVTSIGDYAFQNCWSFTGPLTIGSSVKTIGEDAFYHCSGFTGSLTIPKSVTSIGKGAFYGCSGFTGPLTIGSSVKTIGEAAFRLCDNFESIICLTPNAPHYYDNDFPDNIIIRVPTGRRSSYKAHNDWRGFPDIYEIGDVNHSEKITVSDAVADANYIIGIEPAGTFDEICGDMNLDGRVSLLDVSQIIDTVSEYNPDDMDVIVKAESRVSAMTNGELKVLRSNNGISGITVACDYDVTAFQCDIHADGIRPEDIILDNSLEATHSLTVSQINDDTVRAIIFSMESATIDKSERIIWLDINNTSEIEIKNIIAADPNALEYNLANVIAPGVTSNIDYVDLESCGLSSRDGCLHISGAIGKRLNVYDISGKTVYRSLIVSDDYSVSLAPGLYIVAIDSYKTKLIVDK